MSEDMLHMTIPYFGGFGCPPTIEAVAENKVVSDGGCYIASGRR